MIYTRDKQKEQRQPMQAEREELQQATRRFIVSLVRTGGSAALLPLTSLPREPRQHFLAAGREFTRGWTTLVREFADSIEEMVKDTSTPADSGDGVRPSGEAEESQET